MEDVKTLLLLLVLLLSLFGFHLVDNGYSVVRQLNYKLCPSNIMLYTLATLTPNILNTLTVLVCVPLLHYIFLSHLNHFVPNMLHRLGIGSALIFFEELAGNVIVLSSWEDYNEAYNTFKISN